MHNITPLFKINARNVLLNRGIVVKNVFYVCFYFSIKKYKNMSFMFYYVYVFLFKNIYNILTWPKEP